MASFIQIILWGRSVALYSTRGCAMLATGRRQHIRARLFSSGHWLLPALSLARIIRAWVIAPLKTRGGTGRLVAPVGAGWMQESVVIDKNPDGTLRRSSGLSVLFLPMRSAAG